MSDMVPSRDTRPHGALVVPTLGVKNVTPDLRKRFKAAAAQEGMTYAEMIEFWLDERDKRLENQRRQQNHPLARANRGSV